MSPEIRPKSFGTFEKQAPGPVSRTSRNFSGVLRETYLSLYLQNRGVSSQETLQLFWFLFPLQHKKRPALQNKRVGVLRIILFVSSKRRCSVSRNFAVILILFPLQHMKRPALQNKQVGVLRMAFRARKVFGSFEKRTPGLCSLFHKRSQSWQEVSLAPLCFYLT